MKHKDILNLIDDKIDQKIRNEKIRVTWAVMGEWTKMKYRDKVQALMRDYHLSFSRIEDLIKKDFGEDEG